MAQTLNPDPTPDTGAQLPGPNPLEFYLAKQTAAGREVRGFKPGGQTMSKFVGAPIKANNANEARMIGAEKFHKMGYAGQLDWLTKNGAPPALIDYHKSTAPATPTLPPSVLAMPNQPDRAGPNPGANVDQRFGAMAQQNADRNAAVKKAVTTAHASQVANPAATVDAARAVQAAGLAKDGITDLGGGAKVMQNKYGTGFAVPMPVGPRQPGVIRDEKGTVDVGKMMANKGSNGPVPYVPPTPGTPFANSPTAGETRPEVQQQIATGIASLMPGASERLEADRNREVKSYTDANAAQYGGNVAAKATNYIRSGGFTTGDGTPPTAIAKSSPKPAAAKPTDVVQSGPFKMPSLQEAMSPPKRSGPMPHIQQDYKPVKDIPAAKTIAGYNVEPSFTAEEAKQADAHNRQGTKDLEAARVEQWNNHLEQIRKYAADNGIPLSDLTQNNLPQSSDITPGSEEMGTTLQPTPGLAKVWGNFKPKGVAFKQHGTGREVTWDELIRDTYGRATNTNAPHHPSLRQLFQSGFDQITSR